MHVIVALTKLEIQISRRAIGVNQIINMSLNLNKSHHWLLNRNCNLSQYAISHTHNTLKTKPTHIHMNLNNQKQHGEIRKYLA